MYLHRQLTLSITLFLTFFLLMTNAAFASESSVKGAVCVVRSGDKVVLVNEIVTKKLSLPAGTVVAGEDPRATAQRETWEETGLVVTVGDVLAKNENAIFYDCVSDSEIVAFQFNNNLDGNELPVWFAPHYGIEIASAMLIDPSVVNKSDYRFPEQLDWLVETLAKTTDQSVLYIGNLIEAAPVLNQVELEWMLNLQHSLTQLNPELKWAVDSLILAMSELSSSSLLLILFPLICWRFGKEFSYKVFFALTMTSLLALVAQQGFAYPRPHVYLPAVELTQSYGFSLPSLPMAVLVCVGVMLLHALQKLSINRYSMALLAIVVWMGLGKFYSGAAFIVDSFSGVLLGALCAWHLIRLETKPEINVMTLLSSKVVWMGLVVVCAVLTLVWPIPAFTYWLAVTITITGLILTLNRDKALVTGRAAMIAALSLLVANFLISLGVEQISHSGLWSLVTEALRYPVLIIIFATIIRTSAKAK